MEKEFLLRECYAGSIETFKSSQTKNDSLLPMIFNSEVDWGLRGQNEKPQSDYMSQLKTNKKHQQIINLLKRCKYHIN